MEVLWGDGRKEELKWKSNNCMLLEGLKWVLEKQTLFKQMSVEAEYHSGTEENRIKNNKLLIGFGSACIFILVNKT